MRSQELQSVILKAVVSTNTPRPSKAKEVVGAIVIGLVMSIPIFMWGMS